MEKLKVPCPEADDLGDQLGLPLERRNFLSQEMDRMVREHTMGGMRIVILPYVLQQIQEFCRTQEEFTWCTCNHMVWLYRSGRILAK